MNDQRFATIIDGFSETAKMAPDGFYDAAFYASGGYDFDETNADARWTVGALIVEAGSRGTVFAYTPRTDEFKTRLSPERGVYKHATGDEPYLPQHVARRIKRRKAEETRRKSQREHMYAPDDPAENGTTVSGYLLRAKIRGECDNGLPPGTSDSFGSRIARNAAREYRELGLGWQIAIVLVVVWVVISVIMMVE